MADERGLREYRGRILDASGNTMKITGRIPTMVSTPTGNFRTQIIIFKTNNNVSHHMLLGMDILKFANINFGSGTIEFTRGVNNNLGSVNTEKTSFLHIDISDLEIKGTQEETTRITINEEEQGAEFSMKNGEFPTPRSDSNTPEISDLDSALQQRQEHQGCQQRQERQQRQQRPEHQECQQRQERQERPKHKVSVHINETIVLPRNTTSVMCVKINKQLKNKQCLCLEGRQIYPNVFVSTACSIINNQCMHVQFVNLRNAHVTLRSGVMLSEGEYMLNDTLKLDDDYVRSQTPQTNDKLETHTYKKLDKKDVNCKDDNIKPRLLELLLKYRKAIWLQGEPPGHYNGEKLAITQKEETVVNRPPYRIPYAFQNELNDNIQEMLRTGIISKSRSNYNSPVVVVKKKSGELRACIDFRELNKTIVPVQYPLPRISDLLNNIGQATYLSSLDLAQAFHQCQIREEDRQKTAFTVNNTKYEFNVVPFGLQSSPTFFARVVNNVLYDLLGDRCMAYLDDIVIYTKTKEEHLQVLERVLNRLVEHGIKLKLSKCTFCTTELKFLGFRLTNQGMTMDPEKVKAISDMPMPKNKKETQSLLGVLNYYRPLIKNFASLAEPLYALLRKNVKFKWTKDQTRAVNALKSKLTEAPILKFPDLELPFVIHCDASDVGMGAVLMQAYDGILHPVAYMSKTWNSAQRNYSATKKEALALTYALENFRTIIFTLPVDVYTDHQPLLGALQKPTKDECLTRWSLLIQEYGVKIHYLKGARNIFADTLSRLPVPVTIEPPNNIDNQLEENLLSRNKVCQTSENVPIKAPWTKAELYEAQQKDETVKNIIAQLKGKKLVNNPAPAKFLLINYLRKMRASLILSII